MASGYQEDLNTTRFGIDPNAHAIPDGPTHSERYSHTEHSTTTANGGTTLENAKNTILSSKSTMNSISNSPQAQSVRDTVQNVLAKCNDLDNTDPVPGPVAQNVKAEGVKTKNEFADLINSRTTPDQPAATGQPLTHYHSMFYRLLSWKNPRATTISFLLSVAFIFSARYLNIIRYIFKGLWMILGTTAGMEVAGKLALGKGFTSQVRPRKYYVIPKASLERLLDDVEQFINFFVIEFQRVVFAENLLATIAAFFSSLISYFLIKFVPLWGLALIATSVVYLGPLVYLQNQEFIDAQIEHAGKVVNQQAHQIRDLAAQHTGNAAKTFQNYAGEYTNIAQDKINQYRGRSSSPEVPIKKEDFPAAPRGEPTIPREPREPLVSLDDAVPTTEKTAQPAF